ncbi:MAG: hypothetical protein A3F54_05230 [Candidatus Kerfeldbacteria bacterium RIFCSPHIGHO2_12_FULL_48_17]|uniref:CDP-alcohol phosphatidyltransferase n=1 Tax=Candidatus Kerfeldbacteria bacterium RIFCSPHIGHO2_12_FULL_48_17 TaxID=1798542 RepID=A0A1G2B3L0_9BACT|nr:MAG: hypothetical protein A3F54_05230 [Candidatus Kerfeldbacteria bacterium RIFCSPHIGHO2_12_FULL_48_17]
MNTIPGASADHPFSSVSKIKTIRDVRVFQKPHDSIFAKLIIRRISRIFTFYLMRVRWATPNVVSTLALLFGFAAALFFLSPTYGMRVWGVVLLQLSLVLDCCDGELARIRGLQSPFGAWLDSVYDRLKEAAMIFAMALFVYQQGANGGNVNILFVGFAAVLGLQIMSFLREAKKSSWPTSRTAEFYILPTVYIGSVDVIIYGVSFAVLLGLQLWAVWFFALISIPLIVKQIASAWGLHKKKAAE